MRTTPASTAGAGTEDLLRRVAEQPGDRPGVGLPAPPRLRVVVLTCMDARVMPEALLGLRPGEAHVLRNAGGLLTDDVIRSLAISQRRLDTTEVVVIRHTQCGMQSLDQDALVAELTDAGGAPPPWRPGGFGDLEQILAEDLARLAADPYLAATDRIRGFVYDVMTGDLLEVSAASSAGAR